MVTQQDERLKIQDVMYDDHQFILDRGEISGNYFMFHFHSLIHPGLQCRVMLLNKCYSFIIVGHGTAQFFPTFDALLKALKVALREFDAERTHGTTKQRLSSRSSHPVRSTN